MAVHVGVIGLGGWGEATGGSTGKGHWDRRGGWRLQKAVQMGVRRQTFLRGEVIARGGSSSPGLCISHTGAGGAPYSGRRRQGRLASPAGAACVDRR